MRRSTSSTSARTTEDSSSALACASSSWRPSRGRRRMGHVHSDSVHGYSLLVAGRRHQEGTTGTIHAPLTINTPRQMLPLHWKRGCPGCQPAPSPPPPHTHMNKSESATYARMHARTHLDKAKPQSNRRHASKFSSQSRTHCFHIHSTFCCQLPHCLL